MTVPFKFAHPAMAVLAIALGINDLRGARRDDAEKKDPTLRATKEVFALFGEGFWISGTRYSYIRGIILVCLGVGLLIYSLLS